MGGESGDTGANGYGEHEEGMTMGTYDNGEMGYGIPGVSEGFTPGADWGGEKGMTTGPTGGEKGGTEIGAGPEIRGESEKPAGKTETAAKAEKTAAGSKTKKRRPTFLGLDESWFESTGEARKLKEKLGE